MLSLDNFLELRNLKNNLNKDFTNKIEYPINKLNKPVNYGNYQFKVNKSKISFNILNHHSHSISSDDRFQLITSYDPKLNLGRRNGQGIICADNNNILILPIFYSIRFFEKLNIFVCYFDDLHYYFDIKGRYLKSVKGSSEHNKSPQFAFLNDDSQTIVKIDFPQEYILHQILSYNMFVVKKDTFLGIINNSGKILLECLYEKIIVNEANSYAFLQKNNSVYKLNLKTFDKQQLQFQEIIDSKKGFIKVQRKDQFRLKRYGLINEIGETVLKAEYDFIDYNYTNDRFKVFSGNYSWNWSKASDDVFMKYILDGSWNYMELHGTLDNGKWGIIDSNNKLILDYKYDWIEEFSETYYLINIGGKLYNYYDGNVRRDCLAIIDGKWNISDKNGTIINKTFTADIESLRKELKSSKIKKFFKSTDVKALKINTLQQHA
ncbi:WG repeat-containing protein [Winogradskyella sp.]|uniref:WG repeat-containing protein n=1 Tax=Winogradskyella sp. TaxID=1883156 RepID=UPI002621EF40|nr:WG repeat-containing protein [Winogradskyella sp.]